MLRMGDQRPRCCIAEQDIEPAPMKCRHLLPPESSPTSTQQVITVERGGKPLFIRGRCNSLCPLSAKSRHLRCHRSHPVTKPRVDPAGCTPNGFYVCLSVLRQL